MNTTRRISRLAAFGLAVLLSLTAPAVMAADSTAPPQYGPGMMGGYGGHGMGPGMMGDGYGSGMMGGGMMGPCWGSELDLTPEQQARINKIHDETRKSNWALMGEIMDQQARLRDLNLAPKRDDAAIDAAHKEFGKLRQQMYGAAMAAHQRMEAVLTKEQQEKLRNFAHRGWAPSPEK